MIPILTTLIIIFIIGVIHALFSNHHKVIEEKKQEAIKLAFDKKDTSDKIIVKYKGSEYDITKFVKKHPGGKKVLVENSGNDVEQLMIENDHSENAYKLLETFKIV